MSNTTLVKRTPDPVVVNMLQAAHGMFDQLSIVTNLKFPDDGFPFTMAVAQVVTERGEYRWPALVRLDKGQDEVDVLPDAMDEALKGALILAGVREDADPAQVAQLKMAIAELVGPVPLEAPALVERIEGVRVPALLGQGQPDWKEIDKDPEAHGYEYCQNPEKTPHAIRDYWSGALFLPSYDVARLNFERHGLRLCTTCAFDLIPTKKGKK